MKLLQHFKELTVRPKNAKELKGLILKLAIQGKLTANWRNDNPNVEPASVLLKKIKKDKTKGIYELSKKEIPFDLPKTWVWSLLGKLCSVQTGKKDANYGTVNGQYNFYTCAQKPIKSPTYTFEGESIILPGNGANVGLVTFVNEKFEAYQRTYVLNNFRHLYPLYIKTALQALWKDNLGRQYGSAINYIKMGNITEFKFPIAPLEEQKEIVKVVETLFKEVEELEQLTVERIGLKEDFVTSALNQLTTNNANQEWSFLQDHFKSFFNETTNIKKLRETVLQLAVQGKLTADWRANNPDTEDASILLKRIQKEKAQLIKDKKIKDEKKISSITKDEIPYDLPESWVWCRMQDLCPNISSGSTPPKPFFKEEGVPYLKVYNIRNQNIDFAYRQQFVDTEYHSTKLKRSILRPGDVIMNIVGPPLGKVAIIPNDYPEWNCNQAISFFKPLKRELNTWIYTFLLAGTFLDRIELIGTAGQDNISVTKSKTIMLPLPPLEEQKAIVQKVNALMGLCDSLEQEVKQSQEHSAQLMQSCLREVFEGESKIDLV
jgi:type I restriction enzyme S subunit